MRTWETANIEKKIVVAVFADPNFSGAKSKETCTSKVNNTKK